MAEKRVLAASIMTGRCVSFTACHERLHSGDMLTRLNCRNGALMPARIVMCVMSFRQIPCEPPFAFNYFFLGRTRQRSFGADKNTDFNGAKSD
jgi:hypothetical protein